MSDDTEVRTCHKCGIERPISMFYVGIEQRRSGRDGRKSWKMPCRECQREKNSAYVSKRRSHAEAIKLASGCADCGIKLDHPEIYDFDHTKDDKSGGVAELYTKGTWEEFLAEIAKCEVVCANCHRMRTKARGSVTFGKSWK